MPLVKYGKQRPITAPVRREINESLNQQVSLERQGIVKQGVPLDRMKSLDGGTVMPASRDFPRRAHATRPAYICVGWHFSKAMYNNTDI